MSGFPGEVRAVLAGVIDSPLCPDLRSPDGGIVFPLSVAESEELCKMAGMWGFDGMTFLSRALRWGILVTGSLARGAAFVLCDKEGLWPEEPLNMFAAVPGTAVTQGILRLFVADMSASLSLRAEFMRVLVLGLTIHAASLSGRWLIMRVGAGEERITFDDEPERVWGRLFPE